MPGDISNTTVTRIYYLVHFWCHALSLGRGGGVTRDIGHGSLFIQALAPEIERAKCEHHYNDYDTDKWAHAFGLFGRRGTSRILCGRHMRTL